MIEVQKILERYARDPVLSSSDQDRYKFLLDRLPLHDAEACSTASFRRFFDEAGFELVKITQDHAELAFSCYFAGVTPFKSIKARNDIPDGFVFAAMAEIAKREGRAYCLCKDSELAKALSLLNGVKVLSSVDLLMREPDLVTLRDNLESNRSWLAAKPAFPLLEQMLHALVARQLPKIYAIATELGQANELRLFRCSARESGLPLIGAGPSFELQSRLHNRLPRGVMRRYHLTYNKVDLLQSGAFRFGANRFAPLRRCQPLKS